ncbi:MAG: hypothetical protein LBL66_00265 [Clostridiales bacterium]|jgi:hypothetical protein|nr:hypothetical protein [Clostridiales bacterium]
MRDKNGKLYCIQTDDAAAVAALENYADMIVWSPQEYAAPVFPRSEKPVLLNLPVCAGRGDIAVLTDNFRRGAYAGVVANNPYALELAREWNVDVFAGSGLNILNQTAARDYKDVLLSPEICEPDYRLFADWQTRNYFLYVYGRLPLMTLCHCVQSTVHSPQSTVKGLSAAAGQGQNEKTKKNSDNNCGLCTVDCRLSYKDEKGNRFEIYRYKMSACYFYLLNAVPHNLVKYKNKVKPHWFFDFRACPIDTALRVLDAFSDPAPRAPEGAFTAGAYFK